MAMLVLAVVAAAGGCGGSGTGGSLEPATSVKESGTVDPEPVTPDASVTALECGQLFRPPAGDRMTLTGRFPASARAGEQAVAGTVEVTSREAIRGVVGPGADVFLVRDGRLVTEPAAQDSVGVRWDLAPGEVETLPGQALLVSCDPGAGALRPGTYEMYARVVVVPDDGVAVESFGGPWPLEVG